MGQAVPPQPRDWEGWNPKKLARVVGRLLAAHHHLLAARQRLAGRIVRHQVVEAGG